MVQTHVTAQRSEIATQLLVPGIRGRQERLTLLLLLLPLLLLLLILLLFLILILLLILLPISLRRSLPDPS